MFLQGECYHGSDDGARDLVKLNFVHDNGSSPGERQAALMARRQGGVSGHLPNGVLFKSRSVALPCGKETRRCCAPGLFIIVGNSRQNSADTGHLYLIPFMYGISGRE